MVILAYYFFTTIEDPQQEVAKHRAFLEGKDIRCRVYISHEGINGQMSASEKDGEAYIAWLKSDERFSEIAFKTHFHPVHVFPRTTVKYRKQLVALDQAVDFSQRGSYITPREFRKALEEKKEDLLILDVRNRYEWEIGHFEGAELLPFENFRDFPLYAQKLQKERDVEATRVLMYCTGGIRCELFSPLLRKAGFRNVYQLQGGVIQYGLDEGSAHWRGKLFVFDDRLSVSIDTKKEAEVISRCTFCQKFSDLYYNCANVECNELFLSCLYCAEERTGCCSTECQQAPRVRAFKKEARPVPFRRLCETCGS